ncbi:hypothetical protein PX554_22755 [Sphingomonas sp. H39-1-10]|nr:hypothetical protein [Sphingomonas pollutisoli]MDF0490949.1 hypothetical protein [Sphingomonas pollutisoli]
MQLDLRGLTPEPQRDHRNIDARLEEFHRGSVPQDIGGDPLAAK